MNRPASLMAGDDKVVAGSFKNRVEAVAARVLPDPVKAQQHRKLAERQDEDTEKER